MQTASLDEIAESCSPASMLKQETQQTIVQSLRERGTVLIGLLCSLTSQMSRIFASIALFQNFPQI